MVCLCFFIQETRISEQGLLVVDNHKLLNRLRRVYLLSLKMSWTTFSCSMRLRLYHLLSARIFSKQWMFVMHALTLTKTKDQINFSIYMNELELWVMRMLIISRRLILLCTLVTCNRCCYWGMWSVVSCAI